MKARTALIAVVAVIAAIPVAFILVHNQTEAANEAALQEQLRLARSEGIPTTWQEYGRQIASVPRGENADLLYEHIPRIPYQNLARISETAENLATKKEPVAITDAKQILRDNAKTISLIDAGAKLTHCWFQRDWSKGLKLFNIDIVQADEIARLIKLRAYLAVALGDSVAAAKNIDELSSIASLLGEDGDDISVLSAQIVHSVCARMTADLAFQDHGDKLYVEALGRLIRNWPKVDVWRNNRNSLLIVLQLADESTTSGGRRDLGVDESEVPSAESINPWLLSRARARVEIVLAEMAFRQALNLPYAQRKAQVASTVKRIEEALTAFPTALAIYKKRFIPDSAWAADLHEDTTRILYQAAYRALSQSQIPPGIKTRDLRSPYDGKPVDYSFDGKQIMITASDPEADGGVRTLTIPTSP